MASLLILVNAILNEVRLVQAIITTTVSSTRTMGALKPGQKFPTPTPGFGDRVFYETLLRQRPDSAMAQEW
jgi:hypothetical protein